MAGNGDDDDAALFRAVDPEDPVCGRSLTFGISLENIPTPRALERRELVRIQARMSRIGFEQAQGLADGFEPFGKPFVILQGLEVCRGLPRELKLKPHQSLVSSAYSAKLPRLLTRPFLASANPDEFAHLRDRAARARSETDRLLAAADLFVLPSLWEGFGLVLLEAMNAGLPVVGTRRGAIPEVVRDGETGLLVPPKDPEALATALIRLLCHPDRARTMGRLGLSRLRREFDLDRAVRAHDDLYVELLREKGFS